MDAAAGAALEGGVEERGAGAGFVGCGAAEVLLRGVVHDEHIGGLHEFFLNAGGGDVDVITVADRGAAAGACDLKGGSEVESFGSAYWVR